MTEKQRSDMIETLHQAFEIWANHVDVEFEKRPQGVPTNINISIISENVIWRNRVSLDEDLCVEP